MNAVSRRVQQFIIIYTPQYIESCVQVTTLFRRLLLVETEGVGPWAQLAYREISISGLMHTCTNNLTVTILNMLTSARKYNKVHVSVHVIKLHIIMIFQKIHGQTKQTMPLYLYRVFVMMILSMSHGCQCFTVF